MSMMKESNQIASKLARLGIRFGNLGMKKCSRWYRLGFAQHNRRFLRNSFELKRKKIYIIYKCSISRSFNSCCNKSYQSLSMSKNLRPIFSLFIIDHKEYLMHLFGEHVHY